MQDLSGQIFGKYTVISLHHSIPARGKYWWLCRCSCGNEKIVRGDHLKSGEIQSCGCFSIEIRKKSNSYDLSGEYGIGRTEKGEIFLFDLDDYEKIKGYCWWVNPKGYAITNGYINGKRTTISLQRLIMGTPTDLDTDHINHNTLDNRKTNLRICTHQKNCVNRRHKGVSKCRGLWRVELYENRKVVYRKYFKTESEAKKAWKDAERKYHAEFSCYG